MRERVRQPLPVPGFSIVALLDWQILQSDGVVREGTVPPGTPGKGRLAGGLAGAAGAYLRLSPWAHGLRRQSCIGVHTQQAGIVYFASIGSVHQANMEWQASRKGDLRIIRPPLLGLILLILLLLLLLLLGKSNTQLLPPPPPLLLRLLLLLLLNLLLRRQTRRGRRRWRRRRQWP